MLAASVLPIVYADGPTLGLPDDELMLTEFAWEWGPGSLDAKIDIDGRGVQFNFTGLEPESGTIVGDSFPVNALAGGTGTFNGDFSGYGYYTMVFFNVGEYPVMVCLKMNTGWTDPPYGTPERDTYWQSRWSDWIEPNAGRVVTLDFSSSGEAWNIDDDPEYPGHTNGEQGTAVWRLDEVSDIGFQVLGSGAGPWSIVVGDLGTYGIIPEVPLGTVAAFLSMFSILVVFVSFKRFRPRFRLQ